jgi:hypothetical protein
MAAALYDNDIWADVNQTSSTTYRVAQFLFWLKEVAVASGRWTVVGSWTGVAHSSGDLIASINTMLGSSSGYFLQHNASGMVFSFQANSANNAQARIYWAPANDPFPAPNSNTVKTTSASQRAIVGGGTDASPTFETIGSTTLAAPAHVVSCPDIDGLPVLGLFWFTQNNSSNAVGSFFVCPVLDALPSDTKPWAVFFTISNVPRVACFTYGTGTEDWQNIQGATITPERALGDSTISSGDRPTSLALCTLNNRYKGRYAAFLSNYSGFAASGSYPLTLTDATAGKKYVCIGHLGLCFPFPTSVTPTSSNATANVAIKLIDGVPSEAPADTTPPTLTLVAPLDGRLSAQEEIVVDLSDTDGVRMFTVWCADRTNASRPIEPVLISTARDAVTPFIVEETDLGGGALRLSVRRKAGWTYPPRFSVSAVDVNGNLLA